VTKTSCKDCLFAIYSNGIQKGCQIGRLEKFGKAVKSSECGTHFMIDRLCNMCRHTKYLDRYISPKEEVRMEVRIKVDIIIPITSLDRTDLALCASGVSSLGPHCVKLIVDQNSEYWKVQEVFSKFCDCPFNVCIVFDQTDEAGKIDHIVNYCKGEYYMIIEQNRIPLMENQLIDDLDKIINDDLQRVLMVRPTDKMNFLTVNRLMHKAVYGNTDSSIIDKIENIAKENKRPDWIREWISK